MNFIKVDECTGYTYPYSRKQMENEFPNINFDIKDDDFDKLINLLGIYRVVESPMPDNLLPDEIILDGGVQYVKGEYVHIWHVSREDDGFNYNKINESKETMEASINFESDRYCCALRSGFKMPDREYRLSMEEPEREKFEALLDILEDIQKDGMLSGLELYEIRDHFNTGVKHEETGDYLIYALKEYFKYYNKIKNEHIRIEKSIIDEYRNSINKIRRPTYGYNE